MIAQAELASAVWACEARALEAFLRAMAEARTRPLAASIRFEQTPPRLDVRGDAAIIPIRGVLTRGPADPWARFFGIDTTSYDEIRETLRMALADPAVSRMVMAIDSPGGDAVGLSSLWDELRDGGAQKPLLASISGQGASAAYYLASAAEAITSEPDAMVGSIGAFAVVADMSEMAGKLGIKVNVVRSGPHKGLGTPGAAVSEEQLAGVQQVIDDLAGGFVRAVAEGRRMGFAQAEELATGAIWIAARALPLGLVDRVGTLADVLAGEAGTEVKMANPVPRSGEHEDEDKDKKSDVDVDIDDEDEEEEDEDEGSDDDEEKESKAAATLAQLEARFGARPDFILRCLKAGYSLARAKREHLELELAEAKAKIVKLNAAAKAGIDPRSLSPVAGEFESETGETLPAPEFIIVARAHRVKHGGTMRDALKAVARSRPRLYEQYIHELRMSGGARAVKAWGSIVPARMPARS